MTLALKEKVIDSDRARAGRLFDPGDERSLDESVSAIWESLRVRGHAGCPVCGGTIARGNEGAGPAEGECASCGSRLK